MQTFWLIWGVIFVAWSVINLTLFFPKDRRLRKVHLGIHISNIIVQLVSMVLWLTIFAPK